MLSLLGYYLVYSHSSTRERAIILILFVIGYAIFTAWFWVTYNMCYLNVGLFLITVTILIYLIMMVYMIRINNIGGLLQFPYVLWIMLFYAINISYDLDNYRNTADLQAFKE
jgi:tryptophan-rich sensory protein